MPFLNKEDFKTHLYPEITDAITRMDDDIVTRGINAAIAEVKAYLSRFDLVKLFGNSSNEPEVSSEHLKNITKDIACWHLIKLANPNVNLELFRTIYTDAIKFLEKVMKGQADPEGWPYKIDDTATPGNENQAIQWSSNRKRRQQF
jgi:phage gp36-like protein